MQKPTIYDWKDSNVSLIGSKFDKDLRLESAETEPAWKNCGQKEGLQIWRIEKFKVVQVVRETYGSFY
jgi:gelsolin